VKNQIKLIVSLLCFLTSAVLSAKGAPGASAAGPNDLDRFRHASPVNERGPNSPAGAHSSEIAGKVKSLVAQGEALLKGKHYDEAISRFNAALALKPQKDVVLIIIRLCSDAYIEKGNLDKALAGANEMIRLDVRHFRGYQARGRIYRRKGQIDKAIRDYDVAIQLNPNFAQLYNNRGVAYSQKGQDNRAIQDFNRAIQMAPRSIDGYVNRGASYDALHNYIRAIADYDQAIRLQPQDPDAYFDRGGAYEKMGNWQKAIEDYREAVRRNPEDPDGYEALAAAYSEIANFDSAVKYQAEAMKLKNVTPSALKRMQEHLRLYQAHKPFREEPKSRQARS
jgi:tetratricopeptide (TPR) repeat protein